MVGSDLEDDGQAGTKDFRELIEGYNSLPDEGEVEVIVAFGGALDDWRGMKFANMPQIVSDAQDGAFGDETHPDAYLYRADGANMDDESSLKLFLDYLRDGYANFDQRFLTLWDHGASYMGFGGDSNFYDPGLSLDEMTRAFERSQIGVFDLIGFDACLMASVEVAKIIEPHANYMVASEELEPGHGWLWSEVIRSYADEDDIVETGKRMVDNFVQNVHGGEFEASGKTLSLLDLSQYDRLEAALNPVMSAYGQRISSNREYSNSLIVGFSAARSYGELGKDNFRFSVDLKHFAQLLLENLPPEAATAQSLNELIDAVDRFVVHSNHDGSRPNSHGVAIDAPENADPRFSDYKINDAWVDFQDTFQAYLQNDVEPPVLTDSYVIDDGTTVVAFADSNLAGVTALYGFMETVESEDYFMVVAETEARPVEKGVYAALAWDKRWFTVEYDSEKITAWMPAAFSGRFVDDDGMEYTIYESEIDYYQAGASDPDFAVMTLVVDESGGVVDHQIQTYQYVYASPEDETGEVRFDKATFQIAPGDSVQFWNWGFHLEDPDKDGWFEANGAVDFVQAPVFQLELLEFGDPALGQPIEYQQVMWAEDASGNGDFYPIAEAPEIPFAVYDDPLERFQALVPEEWAEETPDPEAGEVFVALDSSGNAGVSIFVYDEVVDSLADVADEFETQLAQGGADEIGRGAEETSQGVSVEIFSYSLGAAAYVGMVYLLDDGSSVFIIYSFIPDDLGLIDSLELYALADYTVATFWVN